MPGPRFRIAPSPTGYFHVGGARTALFNWALAKRLGGTFVLRIEDTDEARNRPEWTQGIIDALAWIGISAVDPSFEGPYHQSDDAAADVAAAERLYAEGRAYYCDLTTEQIEAREGVGRAGLRRLLPRSGLGPGPGRVLRFRTPDEGATVVHDVIRGDVTFANDGIEDFVLLRSNGTPVFVLANAVDDIEMAITHVVRGEEHLSNSPKQQLLWEALGHRPPVWAHVPVLVNEQRKKLSKRRDKVALESYRDEGYLAEAMVNYLMTLGWAPKGEAEIVPWSVIEDEFRLEDVTHAPAFFDIKKLTAFNGEYVRALTVDEFVAACEPWIPAHYDRAAFARLAPELQSRARTLADAPAQIDFLFADPVTDAASWDKAMGQPWAGKLLDGVIAGFETAPWEPDALEAEWRAVSESVGAALRLTQGPVRVAVTGRISGPPLYPALVELGRDETLRRLRAARPGGRIVESVRADDTPVGIVRPMAEGTPADVPAAGRRRNHLRRGLFAALLVILVVVGYYVVSLYQVWSTGRSDHTGTADAIVVMGAAQYDGRPSPQLAARLDHVAELWPQGRAPLVVVTGGKRAGDRFTEAQASARYLEDRGVPAGSIVLEDQGTNSYDSLRGVAEQLRARGLHEVVIVTDPYHALRSKLIAEQLGLTAHVSPTPTSVVHGREQFSRELEEAAGVALGRLIGFQHI